MVEVEVEFDYDAELQDELTIRTGDLIHDVKQMDGGWWEGVLGGKRGVFPDNFVRVVSKDGQQKKARKPLGSNSDKEENDSSAADGAVVTLRKHGMGGSFRGDARAGSAAAAVASGSASSAAKKHCRVLFSYNPGHEDELELKLDDVVEVVGEVEDGWWRGTIDGKVGVFPSNFVEVINPRPPLAAAADKSSVENKNLKNENQRDKVPTSSKISSLIQEVEAKAKSLTTAADLVAAGSRKRNNSSTENLNPSGSSSALSSAVAVNPVVAVSAANHVSAATHVAAQQRRQSPLGREAAKKSDHKRATSMSTTEGTTAAAEQSVLANAPKLPPKPGDEVPALLSCPPTATRRPPLPRPRQTNMPYFSQCPSTRPIRKVDSFLLSNERAQLLLGSSCGSGPNIQSQVMTERVSKTRQFLRRFSMFMSIGHKSSPVVEEEEGCLSESSFCTRNRRSPSRKRASITGSSISTPQFSTYGATGDGALLGSRSSTPRRSWSAFFHRFSPKEKHDDGSQFSLISSGVQSCYEPLAYASSLPELADNPRSRRQLCHTSLSDKDVTRSSGVRRIKYPFPYNYSSERTVSRSCQTESPTKQQLGVASIWSSRFKLPKKDAKTQTKSSSPPPSPAVLSRFSSSLSTQSFEHFTFLGKTTTQQDQRSSTPELWRRSNSRQYDNEGDVYEEPSSVYDLPFDSAAEVAVDTRDLRLLQPPKMRRNRIITNVRAFINQKRRTQETDF